MDKSAKNRNSNSSQKDQYSLGILSMENLKVFGDLSSGSNSSREKSNVHERLKAGRLKALETLEKPRPRSTTSRSSIASNGTNISDLITEETIDLNSSISLFMATPAAPPTVPPTGSHVFFEPGEITGRSTLCRSNKNESLSSKNGSQISVADILKSSFVEKARVQYAKRLENVPVLGSQHTSNSSLIDSFSCSRSLPRTADMSNMSLNGGGGISFGSMAGQGSDESFTPAELMQSKLVMGEISWAEEFAAVPAATLSKQALQKIAAPPQTPEIETSVSNSVIAGDPDFSLGNYFQLRSENISFIGGREFFIQMQPGEAAVDQQTMASSIGEKTPLPDNKTYTKVEASAKLERNLMKKMHQEKFNQALQTDAKKPPTSSELLSLSAIDEALRNLDMNSDVSVGSVVQRLRVRGNYGDENDDEDKENATGDDTLCKSRSKSNLADTMSFTDSVLNSTDFQQMQQSIASTSKRQPLSALADYIQGQPSILVTASEENDADIDEWPSTPVKSLGRRVRKSPLSQRNASPTSSDGVQPLASTDEDADRETDEDKTPVNKKRNLTVQTVHNPNSFCSTRLDGCDAVPSSTECDFGISPNLVKSGVSVASVRHVSPLTSPRSCLSSPLLDSTTSSERRQLLVGSGAARRAHTSPAASEASSTSGCNALRKGTNGLAPRSMSRCSNSSEFSHRDGKLLPLKVTHTSLCWGSTKLRTDVRKSMQIKNTSDKRLVVRLSIQGPGFQLVSGDTNSLTLQSMECRTIGINFCPTVSGGAIGSLSFYAPFGANNCQQPGMEIPLYGFGGNASITIQGLLKGPVGASFLTVGNVCDLASGPLTANFKFYNKGPLTAFAGITVDSTVFLKPRLNAAFEVRPSKIIMPPHSETVVQIVFRPSREDIKNILKKTSQVLTLANMRIFCGDEPNRQRMRALVERMTGDQREQLTSSMLDNILCGFPSEQPIRSISMLNEPPEFILDLVTVVRIIDVALTLNRDFDESADTSQLCLPDAEDTVLFRTVCAANSPTPSNMLEPVDELHEADTTSAIEQQPLDRERNWSVKPAAIELNLSNGSLNAIDGTKFCIRNSFRSRQYFEISCNVAHLLQFSPSECYVAPDGGQVEVVVRPLRTPRREVLKKQMQVLIEVSMENERINVPVTFKV
ncbi:GH16460 [Drosophila grimshawi]|uniref:GH16460 n=1 Tax=Drosophila grimshawi TaxID=7222 RepID=B4J0F4_DROGR|nr:GH16460 [Drosophila grimshawi]